MNNKRFKGVAGKGLTTVCLIAAFVIFLSPVNSDSTVLDTLYIRHLEGDVQVKTEETSTEWVPAAINTPLSEGGRVWGPDAAKVELQLKDGTYVRLNENSSLDILTLDKDAFQFYLGTGQAFVNFMGLKGSVLQIDTPVSSIVASDKAYFRIDLSGDGQMKVSVFKGIVYAENKNDKIKIDSKNTLTLKDNRTELAGLGAVDAWERWNRDRDAKTVERKETSKYLPEELDSYSSDLDNNGRWVSSVEYGRIWTPRMVAVGWSPYTVGRWTWIGGDYVWISYEPWGWAPYHYGRWVHVSSIGWGWVPPPRGAVFWSPGYVGWVQTPTHVAWVPLAPGDTYYGYGYYGPGSVNITNINVNKTVINKTVYKNIRVKNAVTVVNHDTFIKGKNVKVKTRVKENPFLQERVDVRPQIKPVKETYMPVVKEIPQTKLPPRQIRQKDVKELKTEKPLMRLIPSMRTKETPKKDVRPLERQEKQVGETIKKEGAKTPEKAPEVKAPEVRKPEEKPEKIRKPKESGLTPQEKQTLRRKFEKQQTRPETEQEKARELEAEHDKALDALIPSKQKLKKNHEKRDRLEGTIERQPKEKKRPAGEVQKEAVPKKSGHQKPVKKTEPEK